MGKQVIPIQFDKDSVWQRVRGRIPIFLDMNAWIELREQKDETSSRIRNQLTELVRSGKAFCPLQSAIMQELFALSGDYLERTAALMEELSLNAIYIIRPELYEWEFDHSWRRMRGESAHDMEGLYACPMGWVGTRTNKVMDSPLNDKARAHLQAFFLKETASTGVSQLAQQMGGRKKEIEAPGYSIAAKQSKETFKGDKKKLFLNEADHAIKLNVYDPILSNLPEEILIPWMSHVVSPDKETLCNKILDEFPALRNFNEIMMAASQQPDKKDDPNDFMDHEIMVAPITYASVFVSRDKGIRDLLLSRTKILSRTKCVYCDSWTKLENWLNTTFAV
jgi:hypothetical protein